MNVPVQFQQPIINPARITYAVQPFITHRRFRISLL